MDLVLTPRFFAVHRMLEPKFMVFGFYCLTGFNRLSYDHIENLIKTYPFSGNTDSGGNRIITTAVLKVVSVVIDGYIAIPFHNNGNTYVKILNFSTMQPVTSTSVTGTVYCLNT